MDGGRLGKAVRTLTVGDDIDLSLLAAGMQCSYGQSRVLEIRGESVV